MPAQSLEPLRHFESVMPSLRRHGRSDSAERKTRGPVSIIAFVGRTRWWLVACALFGEAISLAGTMEPENNLIQRIIESEREIHDMQMRVRWYEPETDNKLVFYQWGYENGKEFIEGEQWSGDDGERSTSRIKYAFDGDKQRNFRANTGEKRTTGGVYALDPTTFSVYGTPKVLLGYGVKQNAQETLGEILAGVQERGRVKLRGIEAIRGHACHVVEAMGVDDGGELFDVRVWIDAERGFRPLQIERFRRLQGVSQWTVLCHRIDNIVLEAFDGVWFPVRGDRQFFNVRWLLPEGMNAAEFEKRYAHLSGTERRRVMSVSVSPRHPKRRIEIEPGTIELNRGIAPESFSVTFPKGCRVWDDFIQTGYQVGGTGETILDEFVGSVNAARRFEGEPAVAVSRDPCQASENRVGGADGRLVQADNGQIPQDQKTIPRFIGEVRNTAVLVATIALLTAAVLCFLAAARGRRGKKGVHGS
jgi:hypothetical protein